MQENIDQGPVREVVTYDGYPGYPRVDRNGNIVFPRKRNPEPKRAAYFKANSDRRRVIKHGVKYEDYLKMFEEQGGVCKICGKEGTGKRSRLNIDHCHTTGRVRGLLCHLCNKGLGCFRDDPRSLAVAIEYLKST